MSVGSSCHINERYANSAAVMAELGTFGAQFAERFLGCVEPTSINVYGEPSDEVRAALDGFGAVLLVENLVGVVRQLKPLGVRETLRLGGKNVAVVGDSEFDSGGGGAQAEIVFLSVATGKSLLVEVADPTEFFGIALHPLCATESDALVASEPGGFVYGTRFVNREFGVLLAADNEGGTCLHYPV